MKYHKENLIFPKGKHERQNDKGRRSRGIRRT